MIHRFYAALKFPALTLFALVLTALSASAQSADRMTNADIQAVITDQVAAFRADNAAAAFSHAAPNIRTIFRTGDNFMAMVKRGYSMIYDPVDFSFEDLREVDGELFQPVIFAGDDLQPVRAVYQMTQIEGVWKIAGVFLEAIEDQMT